MIKSMTGFGRGEHIGAKYSFKVEIKTVNHRYNEISVRMPRYMNFLEENIKKEVKNYISRGRVDIYINLDYIDDTSLNIDIDQDLARESYKKLLALEEDLGINPSLRLTDIISVVDILKVERRIDDEEELWQELKLALVEALVDIDSMRSLEGDSLKKDMEYKLDEILDLLLKIESRADLVLDEFKEKLEARLIDTIDGDFEIDQDRLLMELVIYADKASIDEEIVRLKSHINQYRKIINESGQVGRKLDFLIQEMNREVNTIGSKSSDVAISKWVVAIKAEIEKIREQVQNIE